MKRIYAVTLGNTVSLVAAATPAQARGHVARQVLHVAIPSPAQLVSLTKAGVEVQEAGEAEPQEPTAAPA